MRTPTPTFLILFTLSWFLAACHTTKATTHTQEQRIQSIEDIWQSLTGTITTTTFRPHLAKNPDTLPPISGTPSALNHQITWFPVQQQVTDISTAHTSKLRSTQHISLQDTTNTDKATNTTRHDTVPFYSFVCYTIVLLAFGGVLYFIGRIKDKLRFLI